MTHPLQLWAGPECTVNRVGARWSDQLVKSGFDRRLDDLDRLAALGIQRIRFPMLWERVAPDARDTHDWGWTDSRVEHMRGLGIAPIAGLLHHGSGPRYTQLNDPAFPEKLAAYARECARRYPHIDAWTPVNEPLTTARFSGLYGLWFPHGHDDRTFVRCLLGQVKGTVQAMAAIRESIPGAQLVQTEDLGFITAATRTLAYQADFENLRRWLSLDLLTGRVNPQHGLWRYLVDSGASQAELMELVERPCPPDIVGVNSYVTSERFLDNRLGLYGEHLHGGNARHRYVDVETARVQGRHIGGFEARLRETCERYALPVAITEVHLGCTREEQLRWLHQAWNCAEGLRQEGMDIRAVTAWAAFGTYDWDSLVTREQGHYEPGLWDVSVEPPRPTALARLAAQLARGETPDAAVLDGPGWWQRDLRLAYPCHGEMQASSVCGRPLLITGANGTLGRAYARMCEVRGLPYHLLTRGEMDIADATSVAAALHRWRPWAVVNTAGYVRVDEAETDPRNWRENVEGPAVLAGACQREGVRLLGFSSDLVFDGVKGQAYVESDTPAPLNAYGRSKLEAERRMLSLAPDSLVARTAAFFGPWDPHNFVTLTLAALSRGEPVIAPDDQWVSPTYVPDLVTASLDLLIDGEKGVWHLANQGAVTWAEFARMAALAAGIDASLVQGRASSRLAQRAARPRYAALASERGRMMPPLSSGLARYLTSLEREPRAPARSMPCDAQGAVVDLVVQELVASG